MDNYITLIDGYGLIYRAYFAFMRRPLINKEGKNVSAIYGFFSSLFNYIESCKSNYIVAVLDSKTKTFRHEMYKEYKANRDKTPEDLHAQIEPIIEILKILGIPVLQQDGVEADDIIATIASKCSKEKRFCKIISGDKDLLQLVDDYVTVLRPADGGYKEFFYNDVVESWSVKPNQILDYLSILGDKADNVPGVFGIGEKGATSLILKYGSLEEIYNHIEEITGSTAKKLLESKENAFLSKKLITLKCDLDFEPSKIPQAKIDRTLANSKFIQLGLPSLSSSKKFKNEVKPKADGANNSKLSSINISTTEASNQNQLALQIEVEHDQTQLEKFDDTNANLLTTLEELEKALTKAASKNVVAFDTETTSSDDMSAKLVGFSFSDDGKKGYYFPVINEGDLFSLHKNEDELDRLRVILNRFFATPGLKIIGHNFKYDYKVLKNFGVEVCPCYADTIVGAWLLESDLLHQSLDKLAYRYLNYSTIAYNDIVKKGSTFDRVELNIACSYACEDSIITYRLWNFISKKLADHNLDKLFFELEMPTLHILSGMELYGIYLDSKELADYSRELEKELTSLETGIYKLAGEEFNINSPSQLAQILFVKKALPPSKKTKTGYSTDIDSLLALQNRDPIIPQLLRYRSLKKLKSTYTDSLASFVNKKTGRLHPHFLQTGTATGRLSCKEPNLQNIPIKEEEGRKIRMAFKAKEGHLFLSADYSQIELAVLASLCNDEKLKSAFINKEDIHKKTASLIFNLPQDQISDSQRRIAKSINFGVIYGMSPFGLSKELDIPMGLAKNFIDSYFATYSGVKKFIEDTISKAKATGYILTQGGHRRTIFGINSTNKTQEQAATRVAINSTIQGTASNIVKQAMILIDKKLKALNLKSRLLLQIHDELLFELPENEIEDLKELVETEMKNAANLNVPVSISIETGKSWGEFH